MSFEKDKNFLKFANSVISGAPAPLTNFKTETAKFLKSTSVNLNACSSNDEIIRLFEKECGEEVRRIIDTHLCRDKLEFLKKSDAASEVFRSRGNEFYKQRRLREATRCYTLAAAFAPHDSTSAALAFSNRSACFFESHQYGASLSDIHRFESIYPSNSDKVAVKLQERKLKCVENHKPNQTSENVTFSAEYFKLGNPNPAIPSAENTIGIRYDSVRGRHVVNVSDDPIPPGNLIILEPPFSKILFNAYSFEFRHCTACLKDLNGGGVPCSQCVFALYCSDSCASSKSSHTPTECKISSFLYELKPDRTVHLSLSILLNLEPTDLLTPPSSNLSEVPVPYDSTTYAPIRDLIYHRSILSNADLLQYSMNATVLCTLISLYTEHFKSPAHTSSFSSHLLLHQMNLPCNAHSLYKLSIPQPATPDSIKSSSYDEIGAAAFALLSMINHSCDPNVIRITLRSGVTAVLTLQEIPPNAEIRDNYGVHFATDHLTHRRSHVTSHYNFTCDCSSCREDWPTIDQLTHRQAMRICSCTTACDCSTDISFKNKLEAMQSTHSESESSLTEHTAVDSFKSFRDCLHFFDSNLRKPCHLVCMSQEFMKLALFLISRSDFYEK